ncbi:hypothetical protein ACK3TF_005826 [Chlorella vulgaris]
MPDGELPGRVDCLGPGVWAVAFPLSQGVAELLFESASCAAQALNLLRLRLCLGSPERANQAKELIAAVQAFAAQTDGSDVADWCNEEALQELKKHSLEDLVEMLTEEAMASGGDSGGATTHGPGASGVSEAAIAAIPSTSSAAVAQEPLPAAAAAAAATMEESDFLGVAMCGGRWQAGFSLRLDAAAGRPCRQAHPQPQQLQAGSELEAALLRDLAVLWHGRWSALDSPTTDAAAAVPTVFNMPAKRYLYDAPLAAILAELPTWAELQAYLLQQQATGFLAAAAQHYHGDSQLPAAVWADPDSSAAGTSQLPPHSEHQLAAKGLQRLPGEAPSQTAADSAATGGAAPRRKRGRPEGVAASGGSGGGASPGKRQRTGPVAAGLLQQQRQQAQRHQQKGQQQQQQPGQRQAWRGYTGVNPVPATSNKWRALLSINTGSAGGTSTYRNAYVLEHSDPFVVAAARDVAMVWKVVVMGLDGRGPDGRSKRQSLGILHAELRGNEELLAKLRTATDVPQLRTVLRQLLASGWLDQTSQTLRDALSRSPTPAPVAAAAAEGETLPLPSTPASPAAGGLVHAAACQPTGAELPLELPDRLAAGMQQQKEGQQGQRQQQQQQQKQGQQQAWRGYTGVNWHSTSNKWRAIISAVTGSTEEASTYQKSSVLEHSDPFVVAAARDVAMVWKVIVMGLDGRAPDKGGRRQSLGLLHAELRGNEELLVKLRTATDVPQLRTVLRQLLASGWLDQTSQTLRTAYLPSQAVVAAATDAAAAEGETLPLPSPSSSPAASSPAHAAACRSSPPAEPPELPGAAVAAAAVPADWQQRMEGWQQLAGGQGEAWAGLVEADDACWLRGDGLGAMVTGGHAMQPAAAGHGDSQRQQQQLHQVVQQQQQQQQPHQQQGQHSGATGGTTTEAGEQCTFPGASALLQAAASLADTPQLPGPLLQLQSLLDLPHPAAADSTVNAGNRPATPSAARAAAAAEAAASPPAVRVLPPAALPDVMLPVPGDVLLYCHNCSGVGGLPLLERLLVVRVLPLQHRSAGRSHACECLALARGAAAQELQKEPAPRPACVSLGLSGGKWRQAAVCRKARNWCITERVPRQRFSAVMAALAKLAQGQPSVPMAAAATASTASKPAP